MPQSISRRWLTQAEAAEQLGVTDRTIRKFIATGRLTGYRLGARAVRVDAGELETLLSPIPTGGSSPPPGRSPAAGGKSTSRRRPNRTEPPERAPRSGGAVGGDAA
ncbi:excisionase family DNA-binding protein [Barrientosiimonas humi]|uniref:excisionase family DNA-binding protein n=1 Tax=Barrientosiimonas humi TaxID=999931 RepID=UPI0011509985|nr:helix-turn-helix domain-containing protein [Barrientosiimonas humi]